MYRRFPKLNEEDYSIAKKNGISRACLRSRVFYYGWDIKKARSTQKKKSSKYEKIPQYVRDMAKKNGINQETLCARIFRLGWDMERACKEPLRGVSSKTYVLDGLEYSGYSKKLKYNPEYHTNQYSRYTEEDIIYIVSMWEKDIPKEDIAMAVGKTHGAVTGKIYLLRKANKYDYYKKLAKEFY